MPIAYTVRCTFTDPDIARRWADWLLEEHLQDVVDAGAESAALIELEGAPLTLEARYTFGERAAFDAYVQDSAPRLRAQGLERFPLDLGLSYERSVGVIRGRR